MEKIIQSKTLLNPVLIIDKSPMDNTYLCLANKIQTKYGLSRWMNKFSELILKNMWRPMDEYSTDNVVINKYINYLEIYKSIQNMIVRKSKIIGGENKETFHLYKNILSNITHKEITYPMINQESYTVLSKIENKEKSLNKIYTMATAIQKIWVNTSKEINLNNLSLLQTAVVNKYKNVAYGAEVDIKKSISNNVNNFLTESASEKFKIISYLGTSRKQEFEKIIYDNKDKVNIEMTQTIEKKAHYYKNIDNKMKILDSVLTINNKAEFQSTYNKVLKREINNREEINNLQIRRILNSEKRDIDIKYDFYLQTMKIEAYRETVNKLIRNSTKQTSRINLRDVEFSFSLKKISNFTKDFHMRNINHINPWQLVEAISNKLIVRSENEDNTRIFNHSTREIITDDAKTIQNSKLTYLKFPKNEIKDSFGHETKEVRPIEKEVYSRTTLNEAKENSNFKIINEDEISLIADRVYKVIEKRIEIRKDRRGGR